MSAYLTQQRRIRGRLTAPVEGERRLARAPPELGGERRVAVDVENARGQRIRVTRRHDESALVATSDLRHLARLLDGCDVRSTRRQDAVQLAGNDVTRQPRLQ